jgi:hypothetical protein
VKLKYLVFVILMIGFFGCMPPPQDLVLDSFEGLINQETVDYGISEGSTIVVTADNHDPVCGQQALRVAYNLKPSGYMWIARGYGLDVEGAAKWNYRPQEIPWKRYNAISVQMKGTGSGGVVAFDLKDSGGELWRFFLDDDFQGWKEIVCRFDEFSPRSDWQPETADNNEILDFPIMSFQFEPRLRGVGIYMFDCVSVVNRK